MEKLVELWDRVPDTHKHYPENMERFKQRRIIRRLRDNVIFRIKNRGSLNALEWGCGGGILAKELSRRTKRLYVTDILDNCISETIKYCNGNVAGTYKPYIAQDWATLGIDLLVCYSVIWHMPGLMFFIHTLNIWTEQIKPKYIGIQTKEAKETQPILEGEYYQGDNYLRGLFLSFDDVLSSFRIRGYRLTHYNSIKTYSGAQLGHYLFENTRG